MRLLNCLSGVLALGACCAALPAGQGAGTGPTPKTPAPKPIAVVKTWKELEAQPAIDLGDGVKVRLGLEAKSAPRWSGVFLYCLTEGFDPPSTWKNDPLGPVYVAYTFQDEKEKKSGAKGGGSVEHLKGCRLLFARGLDVARVGVHRIQVRDKKGQVLATATLEGTNEFFHPWMPWSYLETFALFPKAEPARGIALPSCGGLNPLVILKEDKKDLPLPERLPTLMPQAPRPGFKIALDGEALVIKSGARFIVGRPHARFLVRWWVNEKPFVPKQLEKFWDEMYHELLREEKELRLPLRFDPQPVGAKEGDRIALQLLYSDEGWHVAGSRPGGWSSVIWMSNRVEFVAGKKKATP
jgi:hypothetical protein